MATERVVIPGIVKNGMVVPQNDTPCPTAPMWPSLLVLRMCTGAEVRIGAVGQGERRGLGDD